MRSEVLTATTIKMVVSWDGAPGILVNIDRRFRGAYFLPIHHPDDGSSKLLERIGQYVHTTQCYILQDSHLQNNNCVRLYVINISVYFYQKIAA
jgi:hypothetical protein